MEIRTGPKAGVCCMISEVKDGGKRLGRQFLKSGRDKCSSPTIGFKAGVNFFKKFVKNIKV
jgi:hypothetical protein